MELLDAASRFGVRQKKPISVEIEPIVMRSTPRSNLSVLTMCRITNQNGTAVTITIPSNNQGLLLVIHAFIDSYSFQ